MPRRRPSRLVSGAALTALAAALGCEAIVSSDVPAYTCTGTSLAVCPHGMYCKGAGCAACEARDVCDGYDNDCDGKVDDGPFSDHDADGYPVCGHLDPASGRFVDVDCDDNDPTVHPGAAETCNGKDDDCDGTADEASQVCPAGQACVAAAQRCVPAASVCTPQNCPPPRVCDETSQQCVSASANPLGASCTSNASCASGICGDGSTLGQGFTQKNGNVCTTPCCTSAECPEDFVCFAAGTGGNYCVGKTSLGRTSGALGIGAGGTSCGADGDCRSGKCGQGGKCLDACCRDSDCTGGTACTINGETGHQVFQCATPPGPKAQNDGCSTDADCRGGVCYNYGDSTFPERHCIASCCGSRACGSIDFGFPIGTYPAICYDANGQIDATFGNDTDAVCIVDFGNVGGGAVGDPCGSDSDCRSARCLPSARKCTDVCCADADCAGPKSPGWVCRPLAQAGSNALHCQPPG